MVFAGSFGYTSTHLYVANAPLRPATVAAPAPTIGSSAATTTTTLTSRVRTTNRPAVTTTASS
jgi:hypothetical protein